MDIIINIADEKSETILAQIAAANGWTRVTQDEVAALLSTQIKEQLSSAAVSGQEQIERKATQAAIKATVDASVSVGLKP